MVADTERLRQKHQESEKELEHLFQALLQQYFGAAAKSVIKGATPCRRAGSCLCKATFGRCHSRKQAALYHADTRW